VFLIFCVSEVNVNVLLAVNKQGLILCLEVADELGEIGALAVHSKLDKRLAALQVAGLERNKSKLQLQTFFFLKVS